MATKEEQIDTGRDASKTDRSLAAGLACCRLSSSLGHADLLGARAALLTTQPPPRGDQWRGGHPSLGRGAGSASSSTGAGTHWCLLDIQTSPWPHPIRRVSRLFGLQTRLLPTSSFTPSSTPTSHPLPPSPPLLIPLTVCPRCPLTGQAGGRGGVGSSHKYRHWTPYSFDQSGKKIQGREEGAAKQGSCK